MCCERLPPNARQRDTRANMAGRGSLMQLDVPGFFKLFEMLRKKRIAHTCNLTQHRKLRIAHRREHRGNSQSNRCVDDRVELRATTFHARSSTTWTNSER